MAGLGAWFGLGLLVLASRVDPTVLAQHGGWVAALHPGHFARALVAFTALSVTFGFITARAEFQRISQEISGAPIRWGLVRGHLCAVAVFAFCSEQISRGFSAGPSSDLVLSGWLISGVLSAIMAWAAVIPWRICRELLTAARGVWLVAAIGAFVAVGAEDFRSILWGRLIGLTVDIVQLMVHPFVPDLLVNPSLGTFASHTFHLMITPECAGFEGAGLMLAFTVAWILVFRKECRFPQVLFLIPASIAAAWLLNSVRLAVLFLIGHWGAPDIAMGGFHSQAGWIGFTGLALCFTLVLHRVPGLTKPAVRASDSRAAENPAAWYLGPFLAILAVSMVARALSNGFEWLYPLRFIAAALVFWRYRSKYARLDWKCTWSAAAAGVVVFAMWLGLDRLTTSTAGSTIGAGLVALPPAARVTWILFRAVAASTTVPIAEELAFRGFLLRRLVSADFEKVNRSRVTLLSLVVSSLAFGALHGNRWVAGTFAGLIYAWAFRRRGRIGDAALAHAVTNGLLAVWVLTSGNWDLW